LEALTDQTLPVLRDDQDSYTFTSGQTFAGLSEVEITSVSNLKQEYIKKDVKIFNVTGTYTPSLKEKKNLIINSLPTDYEAEKYDCEGFSLINITGIKGLKEEVIKKGEKVAGVEGSYEPTLINYPVKPTGRGETIIPTDAEGFSSIELLPFEPMDFEEIKTKSVAYNEQENTMRITLDDEDNTSETIKFFFDS
jgi:hypothetical protein